MKYCCYCINFFTGDNNKLILNIGDQDRDQDPFLQDHLQWYRSHKRSRSVLVILIFSSKDQWSYPSMGWIRESISLAESKKWSENLVHTGSCMFVHFNCNWVWLTIFHASQNAVNCNVIWRGRTRSSKGVSLEFAKTSRWMRESISLAESEKRWR